MGKDRSGFGKKLKEFLFRRDGREEQTESERSDEAGDQTADQTGKEGAQGKACPIIPEETRDWHIVINPGELTALWELWEPEEPLCSLDLRGGGTMEVPMTEWELKKEKLRLSMALERDARKRMTAFKNMEAEIGMAEALERAQTAQEKAGTAPADLPEALREDRTAEHPTQGGLSMDAECRIYLSETKLVAWMIAFPPIGTGQHITYETVFEQIQEQKVSTGVNPEAVARIFRDRTYFQLIPFAFGKAPVQGENGRIEDHFYREMPTDVQIDENGVADYRDTHYIQVVEENQAICDIIPPVEGEPGLCVNGVVVQPAHVTEAKVPKGKNTEISPDGTQLLATKNGHVEFAGGCFYVKSVLDVEGNVDYSTGNIDFNGDVHVHGDVRENFRVRATGGVSVDGLVEAATVEAGGDIIIASGVQGNFKAVLKSKGSIRAKFLENCVAFARKGVMADSIVACQVSSDEFVQTVSGRGAIIGGEIAATYLVKANLMGSQAGRKTVVRLGIQPCVEEEIRENVNNLDDVRAELMQIDAKLDILAVSQGMDEDNQELSKTQLRKSALSLREMQLLRARSQLVLTEPDLTKCRLEAGVLYPITRVEIGRSVLTMEQIKNNCKIKYDSQECEVVVV